MRHTPFSSATAVLGQALLVDSAASLRTVIICVALVTVGAAIAASRKILQLITLLATAAAAVGSVALLVAVFWGLFAAAWLSRSRG